MEASDKKITFVCWLIRAFDNQIYRLCILLTAAIALFLYVGYTDESGDTDEFTTILTITSGTIALISLSISIWAGLFTYRHFDEVWSRRMKWANSNVDKMEARFSYSFKVAFKMFFTLFAGILIILFGIVVGIAYLLEK